jgi:hypothetical protein
LTIEDIQGGVMEIGQAVEAIGTTAQKCSAIPVNFLRIFNYMRSLINNSSTYAKGVAYNLLKNFFGIITNLWQVNSLYTQKEYFKLGQATGIIAKLVLTVELPAVKQLKFLN